MNTTEKKHKNASPSDGVVDSQSVKTVSSSEARGYDGGKKVKGRKRHMVVDTLGHLLAVVVHAANQHDTTSGGRVMKLAKEKYPQIEAFSGDQGDCGTAVDYVASELKVQLHISKKIQDCFAVLPIRWVVERTFAWLGNFRRLSKDYERLVNSAENMVRISMIRITLAKCV